MSIRTTLTGDGAWHQVGTGPATVELISTGVSIMVVIATTEPTGNDGLILTHQGESYHATLVDAIWAQVIESGATAVIAVQPEAS